MPESEVAQKITKVIKTADKLAQDIHKSVEKLAEAVNELRKLRKDDKNGE